MLGPRIGSFVGFQTGNWMPKTNLAGKKKRIWREQNFCRNELAPRQKLIWWEQRIGAPKKTFLAGMHTTIMITTEILVVSRTPHRKRLCS